MEHLAMGHLATQEFHVWKLMKINKWNQYLIILFHGYVL